jgi:hypothetical protein
VEELIAKLEAADVGHSHLDWLIFEALWPEKAKDVRPKHRYLFAGSYTTSLDEALMLVPQGWGWEVGSPYADGGPLDGGRPWAQIWKRGARVRLDGMEYVPSAPGRNHVNANTPALALCIAAVTALAYIADANREPPDPPGFEGGFAENH